MKTLVSGSVLGAIAGAAMLLPLAVSRQRRKCRAARIFNRAATHSCTATGWSRPAVTSTGVGTETALSNIGRCAGGISNSDGRLVCGTHRGDINVGSSRGDPGQTAAGTTAVARGLWRDRTDRMARVATPGARGMAVPTAAGDRTITDADPPTARGRRAPASAGAFSFRFRLAEAPRRGPAMRAGNPSLRLKNWRQPRKWAMLRHPRHL